MADKYTKESAPEAPDAAADAWKDVGVEKEIQPAKVKSRLTYRELEAKVSGIDAQVASLGEEKTAVEAEMAKVKAAAEK